MQFLSGAAAFEGNHMALAIAAHLSLEEIGKGVHALGTHAVQTTGVLVGTLAELTTGVQIGEHQLHGGNAELRVHIHRNTTAVVNHGNGTTLVNLDDDLAAVSGQVLVNRVIQHFEHTVMQTTFIRVTNVHTRTLTHGFKTLQLVNLGGAVLLLCPGRKLLSVLRGRYVITHKSGHYTRVRARLNNIVRHFLRFCVTRHL